MFLFYHSQSLILGHPWTPQNIFKEILRPQSGPGCGEVPSTIMINFRNLGKERLAADQTYQTINGFHSLIEYGRYMAIRCNQHDHLMQVADVSETDVFLFHCKIAIKHHQTMRKMMTICFNFSGFWGSPISSHNGPPEPPDEITPSPRHDLTRIVRNNGKVLSPFKVSGSLRHQDGRSLAG